MLAACATEMPGIEIVDPAAAQFRTVASVPDFCTGDFEAADRIASALRKEMEAAGFRVVTSESDAELVVLPFFRIPDPPWQAPRTEPELGARRPFARPLPVVFSPMPPPRRTSVFGSVPPDYVEQIPQAFSVAELTIQAIPRRTWEEMAGTPDAPMPVAWRLRVTEIYSGDPSASLDSLVRRAAPLFRRIVERTAARD